MQKEQQLEVRCINMPDIIFAIIGIVIIAFPVIVRFLVIPILNYIVRHSNSDTQKCKMCKGEMVDIESFLYLIPVCFNNKYKESAEYYKRNFRRITDTSQIPSGNRACRLFVFQCKSCGYKNVSIVDFLQVRGRELLQGGNIYPYEEFREYIEKNR